MADNAFLRVVARFFKFSVSDSHKRVLVALAAFCRLAYSAPLLSSHPVGLAVWDGR